MTSQVTCSSSVSVFLWGHALLVSGLVFFVVSFATDEWMQVEPFIVYGLWRVCYSGVCLSDSSQYFTPWMKATRAMHTMALMTYMVGVLLALFFNCTSQLLSSPRYQGKARVLEVCTLIGNVLCLVGILVYGPNADSSGTLKYSYGLSILSLVLSTPGAIMVACARHAATGKNSGVGPHDSPDRGARRTEDGRVDDAAPPPGQRSNAGPPLNPGRQYPYGRGRQQHRRGQSAGDDVHPREGGSGDLGRDRAGAGPYPYGYPYPDPTGPPAFVGHQGFRDLPAPAAMAGGGGDRGSGHYDPQPGGERLPPISSVAAHPSAPPFPTPDSFHAPPSYLEAIGMGGSHPQGLG